MKTPHPIAAEFEESVLRVVAKEANRQAVATESDAESDSMAFWGDAARLGWTELLLGRDLTFRDGLLHAAVIAEAIGAAAITTPFFASAVESALLMAECGSAAQQRLYLEPALQGNCVLSVALHEPQGEGALTAPQTIARQSGDGYRIAGTKVLVPHVSHASAIICVASLHGEDSGALACFIVPRTAAGLGVQNLRTSSGDAMYAVTFDDVLVHRDARLTDRNAGAAVTRMLDVAAALSCAQLYGTGRRALELTVQYAKDRKQFGRPIGSFQAVQHHCADMYRILQQTRVLTLQALAGVAEPARSDIRAVSLAKIKAGEGVSEILRLAHQVHGGVGYYLDYPLARLYCIAMGAQSAYGSPSWHRRRLTKILMSEPKEFLPSDAHGRR